MELVFLGTGTSQGVPMIAHPEGGCDLEDSRNWRTRCSIHVKMGEHHIQVDAAPEFRIQCIANRITKMDTFILTHPHADHIYGMDDLRRFCDLNGGIAIPVYTSPFGMQRIREIFPYAIINKPVVAGYPAFQLNEMPELLEVPGGQIQSIYMPHGKLEVLGLVFTEEVTGSKLAYFTDCKEVGQEARRLAKGADVVVLDGLRPEPHPSHMSIAEAVETAVCMSAPRSFLTHVSHLVDHTAMEASLPETIRLAYDGLRVTC